MRFRRMMVPVLAFWLVASLLPASAFADGFRLRVEDLTNGQGVVITDEGSGDAAVGQPGIINLTLDPLTFGTDPLSTSVSTSLTIGISKPVFPTDPGVLAELFLQSITVSTTGPTTLRLTLEDTGYTGGPGTLYVNTSVSDGSWQALGGALTPAGSTLTTQSFADPTDSVPALGADQDTPAALGAIGGIPGTSTGTGSLVFASSSPFSGNSYASFAATGPTYSYSLFTQLLIVFSEAGSLSFNQDTRVTQNAPLNGEPTPEPASILLIATGGLGLAALKRRRSSRLS